MMSINTITTNSTRGTVYLIQGQSYAVEIVTSTGGGSLTCNSSDVVISTDEGVAELPAQSNRLGARGMSS